MSDAVDQTTVTKRKRRTSNKELEVKSLIGNITPNELCRGLRRKSIKTVEVESLVKTMLKKLSGNDELDWHNRLPYSTIKRFTNAIAYAMEKHPTISSTLIEELIEASETRNTPEIYISPLVTEEHIRRLVADVDAMTSDQLEWKHRAKLKILANANAPDDLLLKYAYKIIELSMVKGSNYYFGYIIEPLLQNPHCPDFITDQWFDGHEGIIAHRSPVDMKYLLRILESTKVYDGLKMDVLLKLYRRGAIIINNKEGVISIDDHSE